MYSVRNARAGAATLATYQGRVPPQCFDPGPIFGLEVRVHTSAVLSHESFKLLLEGRGLLKLHVPIGSGGGRALAAPGRDASGRGRGRRSPGGPAPIASLSSGFDWRLGKDGSE